eukprot:3838501-Pleurochrysis_carterae.AAC.3
MLLFLAPSPSFCPFSHTTLLLCCQLDAQPPFMIIVLPPASYPVYAGVEIISAAESSAFRLDTTTAAALRRRALPYDRCTLTPFRESRSPAQCTPAQLLTLAAIVRLRPC